MRLPGGTTWPSWSVPFPAGSTSFSEARPATSKREATAQSPPCRTCLTSSTWKAWSGTRFSSKTYMMPKANSFRKRPRTSPSPERTPPSSSIVTTVVSSCSEAGLTTGLMTWSLWMSPASPALLTPSTPWSLLLDLSPEKPKSSSMEKALKILPISKSNSIVSKALPRLLEIILAILKYGASLPLSKPMDPEMQKSLSKLEEGITPSLAPISYTF